MPRVVMVADSLRGGLGAAVAGGARWLVDHGWELTVAGPGGRESTDLDMAGEVVAVTMPGSIRQLAGARQSARRIRSVIAARRPDVVHCHGLRSFAITRVLARSPAFVTLHGPGASVTDPPGYHQVRLAGFRLVPRLARAAFSAAPDVPGRWQFAPHASPLLAGLDRLAPAAPDAPFLWLGRLEDPKRPEVFVEALARAARQVPVTGWIAGSGTLEPRLRELAARTGAPAEFLGHRADVSSLLGQCRAVILLSAGEAVTFAVQEAMWAGRPVVASDLPGPRWLAGPGSAGVTLADGVDAVATALVRLADPGVAAIEGTAAAGRIREVLTPDAPWPQIERAYRAAIS